MPLWNTNTWYVFLFHVLRMLIILVVIQYSINAIMVFR